MLRRLTGAGVVSAAVFVAVGADRAAACTCVGTLPTFEDEARAASTVLVGRVTTLGEPRWDGDPVSITLDVARTLKGAVRSATVVVWNEGAGTSCGGLFSTLAVGRSVALAVARVADVEPPAEMWADMNFHPPVGDLLVRLGCGVPMTIFASDRERDRWLRRRR